MNDIPVSDTRNFVILGHTGSGKTTLVDALLLKLGLNDRLGSVSAKSSAADYTDEEKARQITIFAKPFNAAYKSGGKSYSMIFTDTPGYMDFQGQVIVACKSADAALVAVDATAGIQVGTRRVCKVAQKQGLARAFIVTGLDKENADFWKIVEDIKTAFGAQCVPVVIPKPDKSGVVDVLAAKDLQGDLASKVSDAKTKLVEFAAETDDTLLEKYLGGEELKPEEIAKGLVDAVAKGGLMPIFACMAQKDIGLAELLEGIVRLLPSPERHKITDVEGKAIAVGANDPFVGFVWRTVNDPFIGQITFCRVIGGTLKSDSELQNTTKNQKERLTSLLVVNGKKQAAIPKATAGDIVAIPKLKATSMGDTLCAHGTKVVCAKMSFPSPVIYQCVSAKTQADEDKLGPALGRITDDDPTIKVERNTETKETLIAGLGDVHIDVAVQMMKNRSHVDLVLTTPKVPYRETVTGLGEGHYKHKKQSGGRGQYGEVYLKIQPKKHGDEEWFENAVVGGVIPHNFIPAVEKGVAEGMVAGSIAGYPVQDVKVSVYDGSYHEVDSSEIAFKIASARAFKEGMAAARPVLLEPIMKVRVSIPDHFMGDINGDLNHRRGRILGMEVDDGMQCVVAEVPQAELFRYAAELRSMTGGQGTFEMEFSRYDVVPSNVAQKVIAAAAANKKKEEED
jgi:elongation factor G